MTHETWGLIRFLVLVPLCLIPSILAQALASEPEPLPVKSVLGSTTFGELMPVTLSPDGEWLAYVVKTRGRDATRPENHRPREVPVWAQGTAINLVNIRDRSVRNLGAKYANSWGPKWAPDGRFLAFLSDRDNEGQANLWVWDVTRDQLRRLSTRTIKGAEIQWFPDSQRVIVATPVEELSAGSKPNHSRTGRNQSESVASTAIVYYGAKREGSVGTTPNSDAWDLNWALCDLAIVDIEAGHVSTIVRNRRVGTFLLSPDGKWVAYASPASFLRAGSQQVLFDIRVLNPETSEDRILASAITLGYRGAEISWSPDCRHIAYREYGPEAKANDLYVIDVKNGTSERRTDFTEHQGGPLSGRPFWDPQGHFLYSITSGALWKASAERRGAIKLASIPNRSIRLLVGKSDNVLFITQDGGSTVVLAHDDVGKRDGFYRVDLTTGESTRLLEASQCYLCENLEEGQEVTTSPDGRLVAYFAEDARHPTDLWLSDPEFRKPEQLTRLNPQLNDYEMGTAQLIDWIGSDGDSLHGALVLPPGFEKGRRYPLIVWVYGGIPFSDRLNEFGLVGSGPFNVQLLASRGYAVFCPDAPQHLGTPMSDLVKTVLPGINKLLDMGIADPERMGLIGHSYGGYSVLALIVQTKRFRAAIELDGLGDFISAYGQMDQSGSAFQTTIAEEGQGLIGGTPWEYRDRYIENSPFFYLNRVATPLLIVHGASDATVAPYLGDEIFVALRRLEKEVEYAKYIGEGHVPTQWRYVNQEDLCQRMIFWFDEHLKQSVHR